MVDSSSARRAACKRHYETMIEYAERHELLLDAVEAGGGETGCRTDHRERSFTMDDDTGHRQTGLHYHGQPSNDYRDARHRNTGRP